MSWMESNHKIIYVPKLIKGMIVHTMLRQWKNEIRIIWKHSKNKNRNKTKNFSKELERISLLFVKNSWGFFETVQWLVNSFFCRWQNKTQKQRNKQWISREYAQGRLSRLLWGPDSRMEKSICDDVSSLSTCPRLLKHISSVLWNSKRGISKGERSSGSTSFPRQETIMK